MTVAFDPKVDMILQYMTNFFASAYPIAGIAIGTLLGGMVIGTLIGLLRSRRG